MAVITYPLNASGGAPLYNARMLRQAFAALMMPGPGPLRTRSGFRPGGAPTVSVTSTTWSVGPFSSIIDTGQSSITGPYLVASDGTDTGAVTAAHATYDRKDILYVQLDDKDESDGSGQLRARPLYLAGTASASPTVPATPARSLLVGTIDVPKSGGGAPVFTPSGLRTVAAGGVMPATAATVPPTSERYPGQLFSRTDLGQLHWWDGTTLQVVYDSSTPELEAMTEVAVQPIAAATLVGVRWQAAGTNVGAFGKPSAFEWTVPTAGLYDVQLAGEVNNGQSGRAFAQVLMGASNDLRNHRNPFGGSSENAFAVSALRRLPAGGVIKAEVYCGTATSMRPSSIVVRRVAP